MGHKIKPTVCEGCKVPKGWGEELIIENAESALKKVCLLTNCEIKDYTVAPIFMEGREKGAHEWMIEFKNEPKDFDNFKVQLDLALQEVNSDYEAKRYNNMTLNAPLVHQARPDLFYDWLKMHNKVGGQHKVPRLSNSRTYLEELLKLSN